MISSTQSLAKFVQYPKIGNVAKVFRSPVIEIRLIVELEKKVLSRGRCVTLNRWKNEFNKKRCCKLDRLLQNFAAKF